MTIQIDVVLFLDLASGSVLVEHDNRTAERVSLFDLISAEARRVVHEPDEINDTLAGVRGLMAALGQTARKLESAQQLETEQRAA